MLKKRNNLCFYFFFVQSIFSAIETLFINKILLYPIEDIDFLKSKVRKNLNPFNFLKISGSLKVASLTMLWTKLCAIWRLYSYCWKRYANYSCVTNRPAKHNRSKLNWGQFQFGSVVIISDNSKFHQSANKLENCHHWNEIYIWIALNYCCIVFVPAPFPNLLLAIMHTPLPPALEPS